MLRPFLALVASLTAVPVLAADPKLPGPKVEWPEVKGFIRGKPTTFPEAELGYSVPYSAPGLIVTVYVYDKGLAKIPNGVESDIVKSEMKQIVEDLDLVVKQGAYKSVKQVGKEEVVRLGPGKNAPTALRRTFEIGRKDGDKLSEAYVMGYKNHFVKLRISYDPEDKTEVEKKIPVLLEALGKELK